MSTSKNAIYKWLKIATHDQKREFAKAAKTSVLYLRHIAHGRRGVTAEMAQRLSAASRTLKHRALYLDQRLLCEACGACPLVPKTPGKVSKVKV